nr:hypothetical protein [Tanacetum cinerariifolium]
MKVNGVRHTLTTARRKLMLLRINLQLLVIVTAVEIVDFLNANQIKYAVTVSSTIYTSCIKQFWTTHKIKTVNDDVRLQALVHGKKVVITEASIRHDLKLNDAKGTSSLPNACKQSKAFFSPQWNEFNNTMASAIICLANNQKFNFSKYILDNLKKNLEAGVLFYMLPRKHKPRRKERKETEVSPTELHTEDHVPTTSNDPLPSGEDRMQLKELMVLCINLSNKVLDLENEVIEMKSSHTTKIAKLESRVEKLEEENRSLTKELKSFNTRVKFLAINKTIVDKVESSKQGRKLVDIDDDADVKLENMYNLDMAHEEIVLSMQDVTDADVKEVAKEMVEVISTAKIIVDEVSTAGGELNVANEEPVSAAPTNIITAQPSEAIKTTVDITTAPKAKEIVFHDKEESTTRTVSSISQAKDKGKAKLFEEPEVLKSRKDQIAIDEEVARMIEAEWNADIKDNIVWNEVVEQVQSIQLDDVRKYQELKRKPVLVAQARKNKMIYLKNMARFKMEFFKGMSYEEIRPLFEEEYNKVQTLFKEGLEIDVERIIAPRKGIRKEKVEKDKIVKKQKDFKLIVVEMAYDLLRLGNPQQDLQDKGVIDNGCSRNMTGNMSNLTDYEEINGGYVAFGGNLKEGKITSRGSQSNGTAVQKNVMMQSSYNNGFQPSSDDRKKVNEDPRQESECKDQENEDNVNNTNNINDASINKVNAVGTNTNNELQFDPEMPGLEDISTFNFSKVKNASTPMETQKPLLKDKAGDEVDVHMYRSMIGSLMYLTSSRPDIMFEMCACARYQVNPTVSHLYVVNKIFRISVRMIMKVSYVKIDRVIWYQLTTTGMTYYY